MDWSDTWRPRLWPVKCVKAAKAIRSESVLFPEDCCVYKMKTVFRELGGRLPADHEAWALVSLVMFCEGLSCSPLAHFNWNFLSSRRLLAATVTGR